MVKGFSVVTPLEEIAHLRNAIKKMREQRGHARDLIQIQMAQLARAERENFSLNCENEALRKEVREGISTD